MAFSMPPWVSTILAGGFPGIGRAESPLVQNPPRRLRSISSANSRPYPNVPEAPRTGFFNLTPAISTESFWLLSIGRAPSMRHRAYVPINFFRREDRAVRAHTFVRAVAARLAGLDREDAANTDSKPAGHRRFEGHQALGARCRRKLGRAGHHCPGTATVYRNV